MLTLQSFATPNTLRVYTAPEPVDLIHQHFYMKINLKNFKFSQRNWIETGL